MSDQQSRNPSSWHLDKRVPVALIVALAVHAMTTIWWAASLTSRVETLETTQTDRSPYFDRVVQVEVEVKRNTELLNNIDSKLDRVLENSRGED